MARLPTTSDVFNAIAEPQRREILSLLAQGERSVNEIVAALGLKQPRLIKETIPQMEERISYGATVMFSLGHDRVGFASQKKHLSFFTASPSLAAKMKSDITPTHKMSGATVHFSPDNPLPAELVKKIVKARVDENEASGKK